MPPAAPAPLLTALRKCGQLADAHLAALDRIWAESAAAPERLAKALHAAGVVTTYQFRKMLVGRAADLVFGKYLIFDKIGEGGMGKVYRAADTNLARLVALKVVRPQLLANKTVLKRYRREAQATATLDHPNIVHLYDADEAGGRHYMAMEYVDGSDLARLVRDNGLLGAAEACEYVRQAALGLHHAHEKGFIHRDVKPSNLLVYGERALEGSAGRAVVKILDMGLVRSLADDEEGDSLADLTRDNTVVGTPDFMSPEQAGDSRSVDGRSDLYSLGCTLVYLLRGKPPYQETNTIAKLLAHQREPVPDVAAVRPDIPAGVAEIAAKLMAKRRENRFATGADVAAALMPYTPDGARVTIHAPAATPRAGTKQLAAATATRTPVAVTVQGIAHPNGDLPSSESISLAEAPVRQRPRRAGIPVWLTVVLGVLGIAIPIAAFAIFAESTPTEPTAVSTRKPPPTRLSEPGKPTPENRPLPDLLPSDTAAVLVYHPRAYWDAEAANVPKGLRGALDALTRNYGFDPRWFERGVVAFQPDGVKYVASGEAAAFDAEWLAEFEKAKGRAVLPADEQGVRRVRYIRANLLVPKEDQAVGALLPPANGIGAVLLSDSQVELNAMLKRLAGGAPPMNVAPRLSDAAANAAKSQPLAFFAASGAFHLPRSGLAAAPTLASLGVELVTAEFHFDRQWKVDITAAGPNAEKLKEFFRNALSNSFDNSSPAASRVAERIRAAADASKPGSDGKHLKLTLTLDGATVNAAIEHFLGK